MENGHGETVNLTPYPELSTSSRVRPRDGLFFLDSFRVKLKKSSQPEVSNVQLLAHGYSTLASVPCRYLNGNVITFN